MGVASSHDDRGKMPLPQENIQLPQLSEESSLLSLLCLLSLLSQGKTARLDTIFGCSDKADSNSDVGSLCCVAAQLMGKLSRGTLGARDKVEKKRGRQADRRPLEKELGLGHLLHFPGFSLSEGVLVNTAETSFLNLRVPPPVLLGMTVQS